tara:strand:+ start:5516 stop:6340 length:825 start_codon:yes stop_codon:yes gene_type:complete
MCKKCGCNTCDTDNTALILNESRAPATILSEGLKHHIDTNRPLINNFYSAGSRDYFDLIAEARSLYSRGILEITNKRDIELLTETDQGYFGIYEGKKVPLDFPMLEEEVINENNLLKQAKLSSEEYQKAKKLKDFNKDDYEWNSTESLYVKEKKSKFKKAGEASGFDMRGLKERINRILEAKFKGKTVDLNKPTRGDSKKFKVYVNSGKKNADGSIKVKKVNFGHGGTTAKKAGQKTMKIRKSNPKARKAFRARHNCDNPGPKTMARYWSCKKW